MGKGKEWSTGWEKHDDTVFTRERAIEFYRRKIRTYDYDVVLSVTW
jgi:hypothetical protein